MSNRNGKTVYSMNRLCKLYICGFGLDSEILVQRNVRTTEALRYCRFEARVINEVARTLVEIIHFRVIL